MPRQLSSDRSGATNRVAATARKAPLYRLSVEGDFWPSDLVAFWDFSESSSPFYAKKYTGDSAYPLYDSGTTNTTKVPFGPFGSSVAFNGTNQYLKILAQDVGDLNIAQFGDEVTVIAWCQPSVRQTSFIGGMWEETGGAGKRQYGLFYDLPTYGGSERVCGHVSHDGAPTPGYPYNKDYSASARYLQTGSMKFIGMVYDSSSVRSYIDGMTDVKTSNNTNPYAYTLGLNRTTSLADFTVGAVVSGNITNFFNGRLGGLAVFRRALTDSEMMQIHIATKSPETPIVSFNFHNDLGAGMTGAASIFGWKSALGTSATDTTTTVSTNFGVANVSGNFYLFRNNESGSSPSIGYFPSLSGLLARQISTIKFRLNNSLAGDNVRILVQIAGAWYATDTTFSVNGNGRTAADWSNAETKTYILNLNGSAWRDVTYIIGTSLGISPSARTTNVPDGPIQSVGFYIESIGGTVRIDDLSIY